MSKELNQVMRMVARHYADQTIAKQLEAGADALEAKAAPVGELIKVVDDIVMERDIMGDICIKTGGVTVAKVIYQYPHTDNASTRHLANLIVDAMSSGAAYQRAQQPQSAEAVATVRTVPGTDWKCLDFAPGFSLQEQDELTKLYTTPQPSAGVVMPDDIDSLEASIDLIDRLQHSNMSVKELELASSEKNVLVNKVRKLIARLNGEEVGRE